MTKLTPLTARQVIKKLRKIGFEQVRQKGSHAQFKHLDNRRTTVPIHPSEQIGRGLLRKILKDIEISPEDWQKMK